MDLPQSTVKASLVQFDARVLKPLLNLERMRSLAVAQAAAGAQLIVFPELSNTGYVELARAGCTVQRGVGRS